ncbi:MAG: beta-propeller fold lactonase family protein, partial [Planctomycetes bacterium]|nr:beta-propeller fold lactonase family protein [Planctomycetota bacterium]
MTIRRISSAVLVGLLATPAAFGGKGFADKPGGGINDPIIQVSASIGPNQGAVFSLTEAQANANYRFDPNTGNMAHVVLNPTSVNPMPLIPGQANGANQFIRIKFPMNINAKKARKSIMKRTVDTAATFNLTPNVQITDQNGNPLAGIPTINGRNVDNVNIANNPGFPAWLDPNNGKNLLLGKSVFAYIATLPTDEDVNSIAAFGNDGTADTVEAAITEVRVRIVEVNKKTINGFWVLKFDDGTGAPRTAGAQPLTVTGITPKSPVSPPTFVTINGNPAQVIESFSRYVLTFSEPVVPQSVGFSAAAVEAFNAANPVIPLLYNANSNVIPNPANLLVPLYPNFRITATPNGVVNFTVPFDVRPINPNNLSEYIIDPVLELPGNVDITLTALRAAVNSNNTNDPVNQTVTSAPTSLYNELFDDAASSTKNFRSNKGRAFTNAPVAPGVLYYSCLSGSGLGAVNLNGDGMETNDPATERLILVSNLTQITACLTNPTYLLGCNPNTFGDGSAVSPIGLGANPPGHLGGPTPIPGINEGSSGSTANANNPFGIFSQGFETVVKNSEGNPRLARNPSVGSIGDVQVGDFLDTLFFDTLNPWVNAAFHASLLGTALNRNSISDPPLPNPPPLRLPVGLEPLDIVFSKQDLLHPAFVLEGEEVFGAGGGGLKMLLPNPINPLAGDVFPTFAHNGPNPQSFTAGVTYGARQQIGNFLYITDRNSGELKILNSNNFAVIDKLKLPDPEGLGLSPDNKRIYVSNYGDDTVSIVGSDPFGAFFHTEINRIKVGNGPRAVAVQPDGEDVFVCNYLGNSVSILDPKTQTVRKMLTEASVKRPWDVVLSPRQLISGWTAGIYFGYIASQQTAKVVIYESGPSGATGIGADSVRWEGEGQFSDIKGMTFDPGSFPGASAGTAGGVYVTHRDTNTGLAMISRLCFSSQLPSAGAFPPVPPPSSVLNAPGIIQRHFTVVGTWGGPLVPLSQQLNFGGQD